MLYEVITIAMQHGLIFLIGDNAQKVLLGIRRIIQQGQSLIAVGGNDDLVKFFRNFVLRLDFNMVWKPPNRCNRTFQPDLIV